MDVTDIKIHIAEDRERFFVGDTVAGVADLTVHKGVPLAAISVSFHCLGEVKWVETSGSPYYLDGYVYYDTINFHEETLPPVTEQSKSTYSLFHVKFASLISVFWCCRCKSEG